MTHSINSVEFLDADHLWETIYLWIYSTEVGGYMKAQHQNVIESLMHRTDPVKAEFELSQTQSPRLLLVEPGGIMLWDDNTSTYPANIDHYLNLIKKDQSWQSDKETV